MVTLEEFEQYVKESKKGLLYGRVTMSSTGQSGVGVICKTRDFAAALISFVASKPGLSHLLDAEESPDIYDIDAGLMVLFKESLFDIKKE